MPIETIENTRCPIALTTRRLDSITGPMDDDVGKASGLPRIFSDLAYLWPVLSPVGDYLKEADAVHRVLRKHLSPGVFQQTSPPKLLELGAGGGHTLHHLLDFYDVTAVDLSSSMLQNCQKLNPGVEVHQGDMRSVRLGRYYDAVLIHDAIDYLQEAEDIALTMKTAAAHLRSGGIVLVAPTYVEETFVDQEVECDQQSHAGIDLTYFSYVHRKSQTGHKVETILVYLIRDGKREVRVVEDRHPGGLFSMDSWISMLEDTGFRVELDHLIQPEQDDGVGVLMFVGTLIP